MFDDPKKELKELEGQLLAAEMNQETAELNTDEFGQIYDEIMEEFNAGRSEDAAAATAEPPIRNFANGYGKNIQTEPQGAPVIQPVPEEQPQPKQKGIRGLVVMACLECIAIAALMVFWYFHFL